MIGIVSKRVEIYYQIGNLRSVEELFMLELPDNTKGLVGVGTNA